jgi:hypothetical protein
MFRLCAFGLVSALCIFTSAAGEAVPPAPPSTLTLVVSAERSLNAVTTAELRRELDRLMRSAAIQVEWRQQAELPLGGAMSDLVVVQFRGDCRVRSERVFFDERGPMAITQVSNGEVLPFTEVLCDRVVAAARPAIDAGEFARRDVLLGRALARVLAHELYHIKGQCREHGRAGVTKRALSGRDLIQDSLVFSAADLRRFASHGTD